MVCHHCRGEEGNAFLLKPRHLTSCLRVCRRSRPVVHFTLAFAACEGLVHGRCCCPLPRHLPHPSSSAWPSPLTLNEGGGGVVEGEEWRLCVFAHSAPTPPEPPHMIPTACPPTTTTTHPTTFAAASHLHAHKCFTPWPPSPAQNRQPRRESRYVDHQAREPSAFWVPSAEYMYTHHCVVSRVWVSTHRSAGLWRRSLSYGCRDSAGVLAGSLAVSASQALLTPATAPLNTRTRHHGTGGGGGTANRSSGGVSLTDLAKVFQQLSSDEAGGVQHDHGSRRVRGDTTAPVTAATIAAASPWGTQQETDCSSSANALRGRSEPASQQRATNSTGAITGSTPASRWTPPRLRKPPHREAAAHRLLISLSPLYAARLATLTDAQFCTELESRLGRLDYSGMMQCLEELVRRVSPVCTTTSAADDGTAGADDSDACRARRHRLMHGKGEAEAEDAVPSATRTRMANHRLLTAVLSVLKQMDVYIMEAEVHRAPPSASGGAASAATALTATRCTDNRPPQKPSQGDCPALHDVPFSIRLSRLLLQWLSREVSRMDAVVSLQVLHLLAQQRLIHMEAVLETLVDAIVVHLERCSSTGTTTTTGPESAPRPFTLEEYSLLVDTLARFQAQLLRLSYLRQLTAHEPPAGHFCAAELRDGTSAVYSEGTRATFTDATDPYWVSAAAAVRRRALERSNHPVANGRLFHHLAEALSLALMNGQQGRVPASMAGAAAASIDAADASSRLLRMNATSFLFLVRALSKLQWWSHNLIAALTAPLTGYVRAHPESALVVVGLVGRRENRSGDVALLEVLQDSLIALLRRRRGALKAQTETRRAPRQGRVAGTDGDANAEGGPSGLVSHWTPHDDDDGGASLAEWEEGREVDLLLLSSAASSTTPAAHRSSRAPLVAAVSTAPSTPSAEASTEGGVTTAPPPEAFASESATSLTFIDLHALPGTVEALCRFHTRTIAVAPPPPKTGAAAAATSAADVRVRLMRHMQSLLDLLLEDTARGITSLDAAARTFAPAFLSRTLLTLLEATALLHQAWGTIGGADTALLTRRRGCTGTATANSPHHPLVIELAYAWILQVMQRRCPPRLPPASQVEEHTAAAAAAAAAYHRVAGSSYWRRAVVVHEALVKAGLLSCTRPRAAYASGPAGAQGGKYYMPGDVLYSAPRVAAAVQLAKRQIEARRQREMAERPEVVEKAQGKTAASRFASERIRGSAQLRRAVASSPSSRSLQQHHRRRTTAVQPARTSDVFAGYTRALSRLL
ncbi:hypothetical protein, conserved [Leishmania tarentolae]|uniref:Uncharacterized protein n=1 Tax=Leishmania tarentolae TaxID=5689 RepID=A0A640K8Y0_LEITA|nr:hypothetical protein, conserved [Leishmania tarentolae]